MLMQIAQELQLEVKRSTRKHELKRLIVEQLVDENVLPDSCLEVYANGIFWEIRDQAIRN